MQRFFKTLRKLKALRSYIILLFCLLGSSSAWALTFTGTVTDSITGETLPFISIRIAGTMYGDETDIDGNFSLNADDTDIMLLFDNINLGLRSATVKPFFAYAYRDNLAVGVRFGYEHISGEVGSLDLNLGLIADMENMGLSNMGLRSENFSWSIFHRNYIGLDRKGTVGVIMEAELLCKTGNTSIWNGAGDERTKSDSRNFAARLNFNPGLAIYVMPQVCVTVTVGVGGLYYNNIRQYDALGNSLGRRDRSGLSLKLNLADIQVGIVAHLWNAKKK